MPEITASTPILVLSGTNRPGANALKVARLVESLYREAKTPCELFSLRELPPAIFRPEAYAKKPPEFAPIQQKVLDAAGLHLVVPEYNGGFPGVLKLFIDHLKFPDSFQDKPVCFTGESDGRFGALRPVEQLQAIFNYRNAYLFPQRVFIPNIEEALTAEGTLVDHALHERLARQCRRFARFVAKL